MPEETSVFGKAACLIEAFRSDDTALPLCELEKRTQLPKATLHRIAQELVKRGWLERVERRYALGIRLFELGQIVQMQKLDLHEIAMPFLEDLYEATHEIVNLGILDGFDVVYVAKISGHRRVPIPTRLGGRLPAHCTALGKAMLANLPASTVAPIFERRLATRTPRSIIDPTALKREFARVARERTAVDREELHLGVVCVAAPILHNGVVAAAVSVTGPAARIYPERIAPAVQTAAFGISRRLSQPLEFQRSLRAESRS